ncbi:hypothetical protein ACIQC9_03010 [Brevundimonas sp. NPDC092305]|uniref:hypothetical protein n=1 Tax=Brevundimonas sp. NPDC092305 TaxID=3363957 RepID=UPI003827CBC1
MKARTLILIAAVALAQPLAGCMTSGPRFTMAEVRTLKPGVTTKAEAIALLGEPSARSAMADGSELLQWMFTEAIYIAAEGRHVAILFGADGKMIRITHQSETRI